MIPALLPVSLLSVNQVSRDFGWSLFQLLHAQGLVPNPEGFERVKISELADLVWRNR